MATQTRSPPLQREVIDLTEEDDDDGGGVAGQDVIGLQADAPKCCVCDGDNPSLIIPCCHSACLACTAQIMRLSGGRCPLCRAEIDALFEPAVGVTLVGDEIASNA